MNQHIKTSVGIIIIVIIAFTVGMFIWQHEKGQPEIDSSPPAHLSKKITEKVAVNQTAPKDNSDTKIPQQDIPTSLSDIPSDWKTYSNDKYNFSIKYPSDWKADDLKEEKNYGINGISIVEIGKVISAGMAFDEGMALDINYSEDMGQYPDMQKLIKANQKSFPDGASKLYSLAGFEGVQSIISVKKGVVYEEGVDLYRKKGNGFYYLRWNAADPNKKGFTAEKYLGKILSTLKFTK